MENNLPIHLQEVLLTSNEASVSRKLSALLKAGQIRKIAPRVYTSNLFDAPESIIRRNVFYILGKLYPGALLSHRSAFEFQPTPTGQFFLTTTYTKKVKLPGITLHLLEGPPPLQEDAQFMGSLYVSHKARAFLENLQITRKAGAESKCLPLNDIEGKLEEIIRVYGENEINHLRDQARKVAERLNMQASFEKLNRLIGAMLSTRPSKLLTSDVAKSRALGLPYDPARISLFETLFRKLITTEFPMRAERNSSPNAFRNFAFFESYFSNYIEGTVFEIEEAKRIIQTNRPLPARNDDSHDVLGTYHIVSNLQEMQIRPNSAEQFLQILCLRHSVLLSSRTHKLPGVFKDKNNFAGNTAFVDYRLVRGTLVKSFDYYTALVHPFAKAAYIMFVISEVHPFLDGNGRVARVMMNAELVSAGQAKIMIPTVFRDDYLLSLKKMTRQEIPDAYIRMLQKAHAFSENVFDESLDGMQAYLQQCNAFSDDSDATLKIVNRN
jgi:hypothetical protein